MESKKPNQSNNVSQENVKAFYERLAQDKVFKARIEEAQTKQECSQIVREAGYDFAVENQHKAESQTRKR